MEKHLANADAVGRVRNALRLALKEAAPESGKGAPVILAVSGGPDSLAMCDAALAVRDVCGLTAVIAHLNHGLRGEAGDADARFVADFAANRQCPADIGWRDVGREAREARVSIEVAARSARYDFLAHAARTRGASQILLAHTADDQVETVLLRIIRGTGIAGLRGMAPSAPHPTDPELTLLRPMLGITRAEILEYCAVQALQPRYDETNDAAHHLRNRVRHELLPLLEQFNPGVRRTLLHLADTARSDLEIVDEATEAVLRSMAVRHGGAVRFDRDAWRQLGPGMQRETLRRAVREVRGDLTHLKFAAIEEARAVLNSDARQGRIALMATAAVEVQPHGFVVTSVTRPV